MREADIRLKIYHGLMEAGYAPLTQTDLNAPFNVTAYNRCMGVLLGLSKKLPQIKGAVFALKKVCDAAVARPPKGRPDIIVLHPTLRSIVVETKRLYLNGKTRSFSFSAIEEKQRRWLTWWMEQGGRGFIGLGVVEKGVANDKLLAGYLVPWCWWLDAEHKIQDYQSSIPYQEYKGMRLHLRQNSLTIENLFGEWLLTYESGVLRIPPGHPATPSE